MEPGGPSFGQLYGEMKLMLAAKGFPKADLQCGKHQHNVFRGNEPGKNFYGVHEHRPALKQKKLLGQGGVHPYPLATGSYNCISGKHTLKDQHGISIGEKLVFFLYSNLIGLHEKIKPCKCRNHHHQGRLGKMKV